MSDNIHKVLFLDIDGTLISETQMLVDRRAIADRSVPQHVIVILNLLCQRTGARIVFNTAHNQPSASAPDIEVALIQQGLHVDHLHPDDVKTRYPSLARDLAVKDWLFRHPEVEHWIAFDDVRFTDEPNLIWIDAVAGLHIGHLNQAIDQLGGDPVLFMP